MLVIAEAQRKWLRQTPPEDVGPASRALARRSNPPLWQSVLVGAAYTGYGSPQSLRSFARTCVGRQCIQPSSLRGVNAVNDVAIRSLWQSVFHRHCLHREYGLPRSFHSLAVTCVILIQKTPPVTRGWHNACVVLPYGNSVSVLLLNAQGAFCPPHTPPAGRSSCVLSSFVSLSLNAKKTPPVTRGCFFT